MLLNIALVVVCFFVCPSSSNCPCDNNKSSVQEDVPKHNRICLRAYDATMRRNLRIRSIKHVFTRKQNTSLCDVFVSFTKNLRPNLDCPGRCNPTPYIDLPWEWIRKLPNSTVPITCTSYLSMYPNITHIGELLELVYWKKIQECNEYYRWRDNVPSIFNARLSIDYLVLWIGSIYDSQLLKYQKSLLNQFKSTHDANVSVIGWDATEDIYSCPPNTGKCISKLKYHPLMPPTFLGLYYTNHLNGWACAQRRPLRSLAHILSILKPEIIILLDDDTYLNVKLLPLFRQKYSNLIHSSQPVVFGTVMYPFNDFTLFIHGGPGYLLNRAAVHRLESTYVYEASEDVMGQSIYYSKLSVLQAGIESSEIKISKKKKIKNKGKEHTHFKI